MDEVTGQLKTNNMKLKGMVTKVRAGPVHLSKSCPSCLACCDICVLWRTDALNQEFLLRCGSHLHYSGSSHVPRRTFQKVTRKRMCVTHMGCGVSKFYLAVRHSKA